MRKVLFLTAIVMLTLAGSGLGQVALYLDEDFTDPRTTQTLPDTAAWFASSGSSTVTQDTTAGTLTLSTLDAGRHILAYFTDGAAAAVAIGQSLVMTYEVQFSFAGGTTALDLANTWRVGVFDSTAGTRVTGDSHGNVFSGYTGYATMQNLGATSGSPMTIRKRTTTTDTNLIGSTGPYTPLGTSGGTANVFSEGNVYTGTLRLTLQDATTMEIEHTMTGGSLSGFSITRTDETSPYTSFDTVAFAAARSGTPAVPAIDDFTLHHVRVEIIPEPSAALLGLLGVGIIGLRRRRSRLA